MLANFPFLLELACAEYSQRFNTKLGDEIYDMPFQSHGRIRMSADGYISGYHGCIAVSSDQNHSWKPLVAMGSELVPWNFLNIIFGTASITAAFILIARLSRSSNVSKLALQR